MKDERRRAKELRVVLLSQLVKLSTREFWIEVRRVEQWLKSPNQNPEREKKTTGHQSSEKWLAVAEPTQTAQAGAN